MLESLGLELGPLMIAREFGFRSKAVDIVCVHGATVADAEWICLRVVSGLSATINQQRCAYQANLRLD